MGNLAVQRGEDGNRIRSIGNDGDRTLPRVINLLTVGRAFRT
ncbi:MAG: hypothetical protein ACOCQ3_02615 [Natronomonas sp.]